MSDKNVQQQSTGTTSTERKTVTVRSGIYPYQIPASGMTIKEFRDQYASTLNIGPETQALIDGQVVEETTIIEEGTELEFRRAQGRKGNFVEYMVEGKI